MIEIGGYSQNKKVEHAVWTFEEILETKITVAAIFDRDYRSSEEVAVFLADFRRKIPNSHVLVRKEIENYALDIDAIAKAVAARSGSTSLLVGAKKIDARVYARDVMERAIEKTRNSTWAQFAATYMKSKGPGRTADATHYGDCLAAFERIWEKLETRIEIVPGKEVIATVNSILQAELKISITIAQIIDNLSKANIAADMANSRP